MKFQHTFAEGVQEGVHLQGVQVWRPSVPHPLYVGFGLRKAQCGCGQKFKSKQAYDEHYIYYAVWQNESGYIPSLFKTKKDKQNAPQHNNPLKK